MEKPYELAEHFDVPEKVIRDAINFYTEKYGDFINNEKY